MFKTVTNFKTRIATAIVTKSALKWGMDQTSRA